MGTIINFSPITRPINFECPKHVLHSPARGVKDGRQVEGGISFSEAMTGFFSTVIKGGDVGLSDYQNAAAQARSSDSSMRFMLSVIAYDINALVDVSYAYQTH